MFATVGALEINIWWLHILPPPHLHRFAKPGVQDRTVSASVDTFANNMATGRSDLDAVEYAEDSTVGRCKYGSVSTIGYLRPQNRTCIPFATYLLVLLMVVLGVVSLVRIGITSAPMQSQEILNEVKSIIDRVSSQGCNYSCPYGRKSVIRMSASANGAGIGDRLTCFENIFRLAEVTCAQVALAPPRYFLTSGHDTQVEAADWSAYIDFNKFHDGYSVIAPGIQAPIPAQSTSDDELLSRMLSALKHVKTNTPWTLDTGDANIFSLDVALYGPHGTHRLAFPPLPSCSTFFQPSHQVLSLADRFLQIAELTNGSFTHFHLRRGDLAFDSSGRDISSVANLRAALECYAKHGGAPIAEARHRPVVFFTDETDKAYLDNLEAMLGMYFERVVNGENVMKQAQVTDGIPGDNNQLYYASLRVYGFSLFHMSVHHNCHLEDCDELLPASECKHRHSKLLTFY